MGISSLFKKFMFARGLNIENGKILIFGVRLVLASLGTVCNIQDIIEKRYKKEGISLLYRAGKVGGIELASAIAKSVKIKSTSELIKVVLEGNTQLTGWGIFELIRRNKDTKETIFHVTESPFTYYFGRTGKAVCHLTRGLAAGFMTNVDKKGMDCIETKCMSMGSLYCELLVRPTEKFDLNNKLVQEQLPIDEIVKGKGLPVSKGFEKFAKKKI